MSQPQTDPKTTQPQIDPAEAEKSSFPDSDGELMILTDDEEIEMQNSKNIGQNQESSPKVKTENEEIALGNLQDTSANEPDDSNITVTEKPTSIHTGMV